VAIQDPGDDFIRIKSGQAAKQRDGIFIGARTHGPEARNGDIQERDGATAPAQSQVRHAFGSLQIEDHFFEQRA